MVQRATTAPGQSRWLKLVLVLGLMVPPVAARGFDPAATSEVVRAVLVHPLVNDLAPLMVLAKYALLAVVVVCIVRPALLGPLGWGYYAIALGVIAVGQNVAHTDEYGWAWLVGNTALELVVAVFAAIDAAGGRSRIEPNHLRRGRLWVLAPMALAWLFPYVLRGEDAVAGVTLAALSNEAGLTYCMVTPVVLGLMILYADGVHAPTLAVAAWVGLLFGIVNAATWFVMVPASWWMGVLHLPLLILSAYAVWLSRRAPRHRSHGCVLPPRIGRVAPGRGSRR